MERLQAFVAGLAMLGLIVGIVFVAIFDEPVPEGTVVTEEQFWWTMVCAALAIIAFYCFKKTFED